MSRPLDIIHHLAVSIGPRPSASPATRRAATWVADQLRAAGFDVEMQTFRGLATYSLTYTLLYGAFVAAGWLVKPAPLLATLLAAIAARAFRGEQSYRPRISRFLPKGAGVNVVARRPARRDHRQTVVLVAHLDTHHAALAFHPALVAGFRRSFVIGLGAMGAILGTALEETLRRRLTRSASPASAPVWLARLAGGFLAANLAFILHRHLFLSHTPGANDNASGVAVILTAAESLPALDHTALWVVVTDCEETGSDGMLAFLDAYRGELDPGSTLFLNVDNVGAGRVTAASEEGALKTYRPDPSLLALAREVIAADELDAGTGPYRLLGTDAEAAIERGYRALSILALDGKGLLPHWHWVTDTSENIEQPTVATALNLVVGIVRRLDERARPR